MAHKKILFHRGLHHNCQRIPFQKILRSKSPTEFIFIGPAPGPKIFVLQLLSCRASCSFELLSVAAHSRLIQSTRNKNFCFQVFFFRQDKKNSSLQFFFVHVCSNYFVQSKKKLCLFVVVHFWTRFKKAEKSFNLWFSGKQSSVSVSESVSSLFRSNLDESLAPLSSITSE